MLRDVAIEQRAVDTDGETGVAQPLFKIPTVVADMVVVTTVADQPVVRPVHLYTHRDADVEDPAGAQNAVDLGKRRSVVENVLEHTMAEDVVDRLRRQ